MDLLRGVGGCELARQIGQVREGQLARERALADAQEDNVGLDGVVYRVVCAFDGRLGLGVARQLAQDLADLLLDFAERGLLGGLAVAVLC